MVSILLTICAILVIAIIAIFKLEQGGIFREYTKISFKEAVDLTGNPIIVFYNNNKKLNFLLDTGANMSMINASALDKCSYKDINKTSENIGIEGTKKTLTTIEMPLKYKDTEYTEEFLVNNLDSAFQEVKAQTGVTLHGILGTTFFTKYKYVIDFEELVAYSKVKL